MIMNKKVLGFMFLGILALLTGSAIPAQDSPNKNYDLNLSWKQGNFSLNEFKVELKGEQNTESFGTYSADVVDYRGNFLDSVFFEVPNLIFYDETNENGTIVDGGTIELNGTDFNLKVPYYKNASEIIIYNENQTEKLRIDVSMYAKEGFGKESGDLNDAVTGEKNETVSPGKENDSKSSGSKEFDDLSKDYWWVLIIILVLLLAYLIWKLNKDK